MVSAKSLLQFAQTRRRRNAFNGCDRVSMRLNCKHQATANWLALQQYGAGTANTVFASKMCSGQSELIAQRVSERLSRFDFKLGRTIIHRQGDPMNAHYATCFALLQASVIARRARTGAIRLR